MNWSWRDSYHSENNMPQITKKNSEYTEKEFLDLLLDKIFPCYKNMIQTELGMLYFRHNDNDTIGAVQMTNSQTYSVSISKLSQ